MRKILNQPIATDDYGSSVYKCQYSGRFVSAGSGIFIGACLPNVSGTYVCAPDSMPEFKQSKANFDEMDANCNTCANLERVSHPKIKGGFLRGKCKKQKTMFNPQFHPDDYMGMPCWEARKARK